MNEDYYNDLEDDSFNMKVSVDHLKWLKEKRLTDLFVEERIEDSYVCDCGRNYGGRCQYPEKYRSGGCN